MYKLFENVDEVSKPVLGTVQGEVPKWVEGSLYRNGTGMYQIGDHKLNHWFDGMAMLQRFHMFDGQVTYQRRFLETDTYKNNMKHKRVTMREFATNVGPDPCKNIFQRFLSTFESAEKSDNTSVTVIPFSDEIYTASETFYWNKIDPATLDRTEKVKIQDKVAVDLTVAHPHMEEDGSLYNIGMSFKRGLHITMVQFPPKKEKDAEFPQGRVVSQVTSPWKIHYPYMHSFAMTQNYLLFVEQPLLYNVPKLILGNFISYFTPKNCLSWFPNIKSKFHIIDKKTGKKVSDCIYETDPFMMFHHGNAYEENDHIIVDLCVYKDATVMDSLYMKNLTSKDTENGMSKLDSRLKRFVLPLKLETGEGSADNLVTLEGTQATCHRTGDKRFFCQGEELADMSVEFPQINYPKYNGKKYSYTYCARWVYKEGMKNTLVKIDVQDKTYLEWAEEHCHVSEPIFIPKTGSQTEDEGVLVSAVNKISPPDDTTSSFLLVLDAVDMSELARVSFDGINRFPKDLHGAYTPDKDKTRQLDEVLY